MYLNVVFLTQTKSYMAFLILQTQKQIKEFRISHKIHLKLLGFETCKITKAVFHEILQKTLSFLFLLGFHIFVQHWHLEDQKCQETKKANKGQLKGQTIIYKHLNIFDRELYAQGLTNHWSLGHLCQHFPIFIASIHLNREPI